MDIRSLACFVAVADELHFGRAAERLHLTQPALSQRIRVLEGIVGTPLFERDRRHVALTAAGAAFLEPARAAIAHAERAKSQALRALRGETGRLKLGFTVIAFYGALPEIVQRFRSRYPEIAIELTEMNSPALEAALAEGTLDLGILHPPLATPGLASSELPPLPMRLALPASHRLAAEAMIPVAALRDEAFLIAPRAIGPHFHDRLMALFHQAGFSPRLVQEVTPMTMLVGLVAAGAGIGFVTQGIAETGRPGVVFREVQPAAPALPLAAAWRDALTPTAERFLAMVVEEMGAAPA